MRFLFLLPLLLASCRHKPVATLAYELTRHGETPVLVPPVEAQGLVSLPKARLETTPVDCDIPGSVVSLEWKGKTAHFRVAPPRELVDEQSRPYAAATEAIEAFRNALTAAVDKGCYTPVEGKHLLRAVAERFTLPSMSVFGLRYGSYQQSGFVDITQDFALEAVSPLPNGFETARYAVADGRIRLMTVDGKPAASSVSQEWLRFPDVLLQYRLVFLISKSAADHDAILLGAPSRDALDRATRAVQAQPDEACRATGANYVCAMVPARSALNPQFQVVANGVPVYVALGGAVREVVSPRGPRLLEAPATLHVRRAFEGRKIPVKGTGADMLSLVLLPGDELAW